MSLFDYPRINFQGAIQLSPGTANNDDFAANFTLPASYGPYAGQPLALMDSKNVEARTYGMSDTDFIAWAQQVQTFDVVGGQPGQTGATFPSEWNYYGAMDSQTVSVSVTGVQTGPGQNAAGPLAGASLSFSGVISDVNSEGSPPSTQFFFDNVTLSAGATTFLSGTPSKGACQWLNFYRNVNLQQDAGAGGYVYHVIRKGPGTTINIPGFDAPHVAGVIFRYYLYRPIAGTNDNAKIDALYKQGKTNPVTVQIIGTFAPLYDYETIFTTPVGRLLVANMATIQTPPGSQNNSSNGKIALAPAVLHQKGNAISIDLSGTFPENYQGNPALPDPKFDFGPLALVVAAAGSSATIGPVDYINVAAGNQHGWILDFDISSNAAAQDILRNPDAAFSLQSRKHGPVLSETLHYFVSNQQGIYAEQFGGGRLFLNQGSEEQATVRVYSRGHELPPPHCPPITVWQYRSIPLQAPGDAEPIQYMKPGEAIVVDTAQPGNYLFTFSIEPCEVPPSGYSSFMNPPYITNSPLISLRILPNSVDFSKYYVDPHAPDPAGNDLLTFGVVYQNVLRTYYLLYPAMNRIFPLNSEQAVTQAAKGILALTEQKIWMTSRYMPRTRDMSLTRRTLLRAWCRKVLAQT